MYHYISLCPTNFVAMLCYSLSSIDKPSSPNLGERRFVKNSDFTLYNVSWNTSDNVANLENYVLIVDGYDKCTPQNIVLHPNSSNYLLKIASGESCNVSLEVTDKCGDVNCSEIITGIFFLVSVAME